MAAHRNASTDSGKAELFVPERNCWRVEHAVRAAFLVDGDAYFKAFVAAAEKAQRSILITGWDFHSRTRLLCDDARGCGLELGVFLNDLVKRRSALDVHILIWDYPMIFGIDREWAPLFGLGWKPRRRVHFRYDNTHPTGGSHHQKIVVIDDAVAFNGGIDLTCRRWDTCAHAANDEHRVSQGTPYPPFHDLMMLVEGNAARALGDLVRERWRRATGEALQPAARLPRWPRRRPGPATSAATPWPDAVEADVRDVSVAISRTEPATNGHQGIREVETLYADMIAGARKAIYIENQYFTADKVGDALEARLGEAHGPEIVVVLRKLSHGWLEELTMETLRTRLIARLRAADRYDRLRVLYPYIDGLKEGTCIDIHSKVMIVDDDVVRIGSSNIANRSMGLDTECDLTIQAGAREDLRQAIRGLRAALLAEHLGCEPEIVQQTIAQEGSARGALSRLHREDRALQPLAELAEIPEAMLSVASVGDPEKPVALADLVKIFNQDADSAVKITSRSASLWTRIAIVAAVVAGLAALWRLTPLADLLDARQIAAWAREFGGQWWAPLVTMLAYTFAAATMFPRPLITLFAVVAFGPWMGFVYAMLGIELAAWITFIAGRLFNRDTVRRVAGVRLNEMIQVLRRRGLLAITALRLVPLAPFAVEGIVAGAVGLKLWHFMLGTAIGMLPGTLTATVFGGQVQAALEDPAKVNYWLIGAALTLMIVATLLVRRWLIRSASAVPQRANSPHGVGSARAA